MAMYGDYAAYSGALYDNTNDGKVDLILRDATGLAGNELDIPTFKSITLPKVTTIGGYGFYGCSYLETLTFGSVVEFVGDNLLYSGKKGKIDLVLNCGQMQAEGNLKPNLETNEWAGYTWKSITLTHTGACDECKAAEQ